MAKKKRGRRQAATGLRTIQASTFKATCLDLMDEIAARHIEVIVTKHGRPVVKVGPVDPVVPSPVGFLRGTIIDDAGLVDPEYDSWEMSDSDPLDRAAS